MLRSHGLAFRQLIFKRQRQIVVEKDKTRRTGEIES
jgi:hypothetical protein